MESMPEAEDRLDVKAIVELFGGREAVVSALQNAGYVITKNGVQKWRDRGIIPTEWLIRLTRIARDRKIPFRWTQFIKKG